MALQRAETSTCLHGLKEGDEHRVVIPRRLVDADLLLPDLGDHAVQPPQALQEPRLLRLGAGAEFPHHYVFNHVCLFSFFHSIQNSRPVRHLSAVRVNSPGSLLSVHAGCSSNLRRVNPAPMTALMISLTVYFRYLHLGIRARTRSS